MQQQLSSSLPQFQLRENNYVLGKRNIGGNAQSIVSRGFLHHTSFLWDYDQTNMDHLTLLNKQPDYRGKRSHDDFRVHIKDHYEEHGANKNLLFGHVKEAASWSFELEVRTLRDALKIAEDEFGGLQGWGWFHGKCWTKVVRL